MPTKLRPLPISETEFQKQFIDLAHLFGFKVAHFRPAMTQHGWRTPVQGDGKGWPDNVLVSERQGRVIFAELKSRDGIVSPEQQEWIRTLKDAGQEVYVWRPDDLEEIAKCLQGVNMKARAENESSDDIKRLQEGFEEVLDLLVEKLRCFHCPAVSRCKYPREYAQYTKSYCKNMLRAWFLRDREDDKEVS